VPEVVRHLVIGGLRITLRCDDAAVSCVFSDRIQRFCTTDPGPSDVVLTARNLAGPAPSGGELVFDSGAVWRLFRTGDGYRVECSTEVFGDEPYKVATFNESFTRGEILLRTAATGSEVDPFGYPLDEVLITQLLGRGRGVEIHGCGIVDRDGCGRLFAGHSGAGKTTTARMWEGEGVTILSDDRIIIRELDGELRMFGSPWHGEPDLAAQGSAPLTAVYLLEQAPENELRALPVSEAVARLFSCGFPLFSNADALEFTVGFLGDVATKVPVYGLRFTPDRRAVEVVRGGGAR
jgi:hypothetical protein